MTADWSVVLRPTVQRILETLVPGERTLKELTAEIGITKQSLQRHLASMEQLGVVSRVYRPTAQGREVIYALRGVSFHIEVHPGAPIIAWAAGGAVDRAVPLTAQITQETERLEVALLLRRVLALPRVAARAFIVLFGSVARGEATWKSDIDLLFVLSVDDPVMRERIEDDTAQAQVTMKHPVQIEFTTDEAFVTGARRIDAIAAREGIVVHTPNSRRCDALWAKMTRSSGIGL
ncbi:MAG: nucleotidyltransferase domain-containing protein [Candidatus Thermoplasmatota archaeon]